MSTESFRRLPIFRSEAEFLDREIPQRGVPAAVRYSTTELKRIPIGICDCVPEKQAMEKLAQCPGLVIANHPPEGPRAVFSFLPDRVDSNGNLQHTVSALSSLENKDVYGAVAARKMILVDTFGQPNPKFSARLRRRQENTLPADLYQQRAQQAQETNEKAIRETIKLIQSGELVVAFPKGEQRESAPWLPGVSVLVAGARNVSNAYCTLLHIDNTGILDRRHYIPGMQAIWPFKPVVTILDVLPMAEIYNQAKELELVDKNGKRASIFEKINQYLQSHYNTLAAAHC